MGKYQPFDDLDAETNDALRKSIARFGVVCPVVIDGNGSIIDGHQRVRIAGELGLTYPVIRRAVKNEDDAIALAFSLNADRRMLTVDQRRAIVADLREQGYSLRAIAGVVNVSRGTVANDVAAAGVQVGHVTGEDGKQYEASRPRPPEGVDPETGEIALPMGNAATSGSDQSEPRDDAPDAAGPGDDEQGQGSPAQSPAPKVASIDESEAGYRQTASRFHKQTREGLLTLDPQRIALVIAPVDRAAWSAFAHDVIAWASDVLSAVDDSTRLRRVQ